MFHLIKSSPYIFRSVIHTCFKAMQYDLLNHLFCSAEVNHYLIYSSDQICLSTGNMLLL